MTTVLIEIPDDLLGNFKNIDEMQRTIFEDFIIEQRQIGNISLERASELLGISYNEFFDLLGKKGVSFINATEADLDKSYENFKQMLKSNSE